MARKHALGPTRTNARRAAAAARAAHGTLDQALSRRAVVGAGALAAVTAGLGASRLGGFQASSQMSVAGSTGGSGGGALTTGQMAIKPVAAKVATPVALAKSISNEHLLKRLTFGPTPALRAQIAQMGAGAWLAQQLDPTSITDPGGQKVAALYPRLNWSIDKVKGMRGQNEEYYQFLYEPALLHTGNAIWSSRQLYEIMVEFWSDHLHVPAPGEKGSWARHRYDADVIRKHALGRFDRMLLASSEHPAMVAYLDSDKSTPAEPNENYARELMELHTLGVHGGYTEKDVKQAALLLTGWQTPWPSETTQWSSRLHYSKPVTVLGRRIANGSGSTGRTSQRHFVQYLATHPATAKHICRKLAIRFVSDDPSDELVNALAKTFLQSNTAIVPVLRQLFSTQEFADAEGAKLRRPFERVVATLRSLDVKFNGKPDGLQQLYWNLSTLGHVPYDWPTPDGFPDTAAGWQSPATALEMFNVTSGLVHDWWDGKLDLPGPKSWLPKPPSNRTAVSDAVAKRVLGRAASDAERAAVSTVLASTKLNKTFTRAGWDREETIALTGLTLFHSPEFMTR